MKAKVTFTILFLLFALAAFGQDVLPFSTELQSRNTRAAYPILARNGFLGFALFYLVQYFSHLLLVQFCRTVSFAARALFWFNLKSFVRAQRNGVMDVFFLRYIFEIVQIIIATIQVFMVDKLTLRASSLKSEHYQLMNKITMSLVVFKKNYALIASNLNRSQIPMFSKFSVVKKLPSNAAKIRDSVSLLKSRNLSPSFNMTRKWRSANMLNIHCLKSFQHSFQMMVLVLRNVCRIPQTSWIITSIALVSFSFSAFSQGTPGSVRFPTALDTSVSLLEVADRASTALSAGITSGATTINVVSTALFPSTGILTVDDERIYYTSKTATTFTVVRGQFGSSATTHASGAVVRMNVVARHHEVLRDSNLALQAKVGSSASLPSTVGHVLTVTSSGVTAWQAPSVTAILPVTDSQTVVKGSSDATKLIRFEVDGLTTGTTRVVTVPDASVVMAGSASALTSGRVAVVTTGGLLLDSSTTAAQLNALSALTNGRVPFQSGGVLADSANFRWDSSANSLLINGGDGNTATIDLIRTTTGTTANYGAVFKNDFTLSSGSVGELWGAGATVIMRGTGGNTSGGKGVSALSATAFIANTGTTDYAQGFYLDARNIGNGTVTHFSGVRVPVIQNTASGTITNAYGINLAQMTAGANNYQFYSAGGQSLLLAGSASVNPLVLRGAASQTADLVQLQNSSSAVLGGFDSTGRVFLGASGTRGTFAGTFTANRTFTLPDASIVVSGSASALTSGRIPFVTTGGLLTDSGNLQWDNTNTRLGIGTTPSFIFDARLTNDNRFNLTQTVEANYGFQLTKSVSGGSFNISWLFYNPINTSNFRFYNNSGVGDVFELRSDGQMNIGGLVGASVGQLAIGITSASRIGQVIRGAAAQSADLIQLQNSAGTVLTSFSSGGAINVFAGFADAVNIAVGTTTGTKIGTATTQKLAFFNSTPIVQPNTTGTATGFTAGAGTSVTDASTFTGGVGSTAYRISDIIKALKDLGLIAQ